MNLIAVVGIGVILSVFTLLLRQYRPELALLLSCLGVVVISSMILLELVPVFSMVRSLMGQISFSADYLRTVIKCLGVCYLTEIGSQLCRESGQLAIGSKIEMAGKVLVLVLSLPMFEKLLETALQLIQM